MVASRTFTFTGRSLDFKKFLHLFEVIRVLFAAVDLDYVDVVLFSFGCEPPLVGGIVTAFRK